MNMFCQIELFLGYVRSFYKKHRPVVRFGSAGIMVGTSVVLPSFYPVQLGLRGIWKISMSLWAVSTTTFLCLSRQKILDNGPHTVFAITIIGILAVFHSPLSLEQFIPYTPFAATMSFLSATQVVPMIRAFIIGTPIPPEITPEIPLDVFIDLESGMATFDQESSQSDDQMRRIHNLPEPWNPMLQLLHAGANFNVNNDPVVSSSFGSQTDIGSHSETSSNVTCDSRDRLL